MDQLGKVKKILTESTIIICDNLDPSTLLLTMKTKSALTQNDVKLIKSKVLESDQAELLLDILMKRPATSYDIFMEALLERAERKDLYDQIKAIEMKHGYVKTGTAASAAVAPAVDSPSVTDLDISDFVGELDSDELSSVYERLGVSHKHVKKAHERANTTDPDKKAKEVLRFWREQTGSSATRRKLLEALKECQYINVMQTLQPKWGISNV